MTFGNSLDILTFLFFGDPKGCDFFNSSVRGCDSSNCILFFKNKMCHFFFFKMCKINLLFDRELNPSTKRVIILSLF